ncbi:hypothetical protein SAMN05216436_10276 [bacterium A37T11]|nr:hypothetical protein SAMN05216436_10276 [bacterium A37T11]
MILRCALFCCFQFTMVYAQQNPAAGFAAIGNTGTALKGINSLSSNQSGIASLRSAAIAITYEQMYLNTDIRYQSAFAAIPGQFGIIGLLVCSYGIRNAYTDLKAGLTYAKNFGPMLRMSLTGNFHQLNIVNYGSSKAFSADFGIQYQLTDNWNAGFHAANIGELSYQENVYGIIPSHYRFGTSYIMSQQVTVSADVKWQKLAGVDMLGGLEYRPIRWLNFRGGLSAHTFKEYVGFGINFQQFTMDYAAAVHSRLGLSSQMELAYGF